MHQLVALMTLFLAFSVCAQGSSSDVDSDETQIVRLSGDMPLPCRAIELNAVKVVLSLVKLNAIVTSSPKTWTTESERLALIQGKRAQAILQAAPLTSSNEPCSVIAGDALHDALYLVLQLVEEGQATLLDRSGKVATVAIRRVGMKGAPHPREGVTLVSVPGARHPFLSLSW